MPQYKKYLEAANRANPEYAPLYVLQGDIALKNGEVGLAAGEYENAIYYDANCVEAYVKYAKILSKLKIAVIFSAIRRNYEKIYFGFR